MKKLTGVSLVDVNDELIVCKSMLHFINSFIFKKVEKLIKLILAGDRFARDIQMAFMVMYIDKDSVAHKFLKKLWHHSFTLHERTGKENLMVEKQEEQLK